MRDYGVVMEAAERFGAGVTRLTLTIPRDEYFTQNDPHMQTLSAHTGNYLFLR